jgi:ArsR family transcriptional regulator, arsenate/arsenite/antimonite-responsive transcriptional repressor
MDSSSVIEALAALAHENRLAIFRLLVQQGPEGLSAGTIAEGVGLTPSSLTFHVQQLTRAGLLSQRRDGRQLIYAADFGAMNALVDYLTENCCGHGGSCKPACAPAKKKATKGKGTTARTRA